MRWFLGALFLLALGMALQMGLLVYAMYVLLGVMLLSRFLAREWVDRISASRECSRLTAQIGDKAAIIVHVRNSGRLPIPWLIVEDSLPRDALTQRPPRIALDGKRMRILQLSGRAEKTLLYQVTFLMRGYYQIGPLLVESGDLFGLHRRFRLETKPHFVLVFPKVVPLRGYELASRRPIGEIRLTHRLFEDPTRIAGVREYRRGDPLNRIHWRATARTATLHCKMYEPSCIAGTTLLLDFHKSVYAPRREPNRSELAVTAAASLANAVYQMGQQIGLVTNGRDAADRILQEGYRQEFGTRSLAVETARMRESSDRLRPVVVETRRGAEQFVRILEALARLELTEGLTFQQLIVEATSRLPRDATVVAIVPTVTAETAIALGNLRRCGYAVTVLLVTYEDDDEAPASLGRLLAEGIDARRVDSEAGIESVCSAELIR